MDRYSYQSDVTTKNITFKIFDSLRGHGSNGEGAHIAHCRNRDIAERIVSALNEADARKKAGAFA